ncbi:hypothetical protein KPP03845_106068 [Streptomyces xanthophaeus]|uniref:hypothetical protein n=1 Tax=Streptomyces xanthophaeus TaxID=67385 RepID=UPI0038702CA9|nr:hypothetical protein KPP03845_106068 [Streptomyces xanthophaeus]
MTGTSSGWVSWVSWDQQRDQGNALDRGIALLAHRLWHRGAPLTAAAMLLFSVLGALEGFAEETLGFSGLLLPLPCTDSSPATASSRRPPRTRRNRN